MGQRSNPALSNAKYLYGKNSSHKVFQHVRVLDGTGAAALEDQTVIVDGTKIAQIGRDLAVPAGAEVFDLTGYTVLPGLRGSDAVAADDIFRSTHVPGQRGDDDPHGGIG